MEEFQDDVKQKILREIQTVETRILEEQERQRQLREGKQNLALSDVHEQIQRVRFPVNVELNIVGIYEQSWFEKR